MNPEIIGLAAAVLTTMCWLPQTWRILRTRDTNAISLPAQAMLVAGVVLWLTYGIMTGSLSVVAANSIGLILTSAVLVLKIRHG